jgi:uncharacterized protein (DUF1501 family)
VPYDAATYATYAADAARWRGTPLPNWPLAPLAPQPSGQQLPTPRAARTLFDAQQCAIVANIGPLIVPTTRTTFANQSVPLPPKLFSHNDQQSVWQASVPEGAQYGWGGRIGDLLAAQNTNSLFTCLSLSGNTVFLSGQQVQPFQLDVNLGSVPFAALAANSLYGSAAGSAALRSILTRNDAHLMANEIGRVNQRSIDANTALSVALAAAPILSPPAGNALAAQLAMVARVISVRSQLGASRQVFLASMGGSTRTQARTRTMRVCFRSSRKRSPGSRRRWDSLAPQTT